MTANVRDQDVKDRDNEIKHLNEKISLLNDQIALLKDQKSVVFKSLTQDSFINEVFHTANPTDMLQKSLAMSQCTVDVFV